MLVELGINNFALIERQDIEFSPGLNILTGETGAGKSILIGALELLLGARASLDFIRTGAEKAEIRALFAVKDLPGLKEKLRELGIEDEEGSLLLSREISRSGNNRVRINGQIATLGIIKEISPFLIDIHGQHEHQALFSEDNQREFLDHFGGRDLKNLKTQVKEAYKNLQKGREELNRLRDSEKERKQRLELLEFQIKELEEADLKPGEEEQLNQEHRILTNVELLYNKCQEIFSNLSGEEMETGINDQLGYLNKELKELREIDSQLENAEELLSSSYYQLQELAREIRSYADGIVFDEASLREVENRIGEINDLKRKYGPSFGEVIEFLDKAKEEHHNLQGSQERTEELEKKIEAGEARYLDLAGQLSQKRKEAAKEMADLLVKELKGLAMPETRFRVDFKRIPDNIDGIKSEGEKIAFFQHGIDQIEFMLSPNPGEDLKPLTRIASGGEISRLMLALKALTADQEQVPTMIFDEIDSGIGGKTAQKVAEKLDQISSRRQVITITHLPHIASMADKHLFIDKEIKDGTTRTMVIELKSSDRTQELARMLEGEQSETALSHAREMLEKAQTKKQGQ